MYFLIMCAILHPHQRLKDDNSNEASDLLSLLISSAEVFFFLEFVSVFSFFV